MNNLESKAKNWTYLGCGVIGDLGARTNVAVLKHTAGLAIIIPVLLSVL